MTKPINIELLKEHKACQNQVDKFKKFFGEEIIPTLELCLLHAQDFNFRWARIFLDEQSQEAFDEAVVLAKKAFEEAIAPAWKVYDEAIAPYRKAYNEAIVPVCKIYDKAVVLAKKAYNEDTAPAWKVYDEAVALVWFNAWESQD